MPGDEFIQLIKIVLQACDSIVAQNDVAAPGPVS